MKIGRIKYAGDLTGNFTTGDQLNVPRTVLDSYLYTAEMAVTSITYEVVGTEYHRENDFTSVYVKEVM